MKKEITSKNYNPVTVGLLIAGAMIAYAVLPIDFIPDLAVGIGQLDDALVLTVGTIAEVVNIIHAVKMNKQPVAENTQRYDFNEYGDDIEEAEYREI